MSAIRGSRADQGVRPPVLDVLHHEAAARDGMKQQQGMA
jgi:hypothetical protein